MPLWEKTTTTHNERENGIYKNLRSDVVGRSAKCFGDFLSVDAFLAHAEIGDLDVSVLVEQDVVQLQIAVNDAPAVEEEESDGDFGSVEPSRRESVKEETNYISAGKTEGPV